eukprot:CAMPEP_0172500620 /NCGR_PEP_ID=MMETSP1066-20121228/140987_1 /TAXON_ID=671091 /ORGANISM="Coscinodiscus wailesii, Strain CCMP2513" /LENGTH=387 /DNA_ID=CAMNT_0013274951 /DNA_START=140 /DNA_END=1303 /DNA_ORIENTATION=-
MANILKVFILISIHLCSAFELSSKPRPTRHPFIGYRGSGNNDASLYDVMNLESSSTYFNVNRRSKRKESTSISYANSPSGDDTEDYKKIKQRSEVNDENNPEQNKSRLVMRRRSRRHMVPINPNPYNIPSNQDDRWEFFYELLVIFFNENGHTNVESGPKVNQSLLRNWMAEQRRSYMKTIGILANEDDIKEVMPLTIEKKKRLDNAGFNWGNFGDINAEEMLESNLKLAINPDKDAKWTSMLQQLKTYREKFGDCDVPLDYDRNLELAEWVDKQRRLKNIMPNRRRVMLDQLDFTWFNDEVHYTVKSGEHRTLWSERLEELKRYKRDHGNCDVPLEFEDNPKLGEWVSRQRKMYRLWRDGRKAPMNVKRVDALERIGFTWDLSKKE